MTSFAAATSVTFFFVSDLGSADRTQVPLPARRSSHSAAQGRVRLVYRSSASSRPQGGSVPTKPLRD